MHSLLKAFDEPVELLVLDFNGTMVDDLGFGINAMELIFHAYGQRPPSKHRFRSEIGSHVMTFYWRHGIPRNASIDDLNSIRNTYYRSRLDQIRFRPGLREVMDACAAAGIPLAVCSGEASRIFYPLVGRAGLRPRFKVIEVEAWSGKVLALKRVCYRAGVREFRRAVYIDDTADGVQAARDAGLRSIGFAHATSWNTAARIEAAAPDRVAHDFKEAFLILGLRFPKR